ncbi:MAG TPA: hypothetical protein VL381_08045, partial [Rhodocyclaceae bacterium]|nr:hypothetical protein [Rhodocyclaceae bacterium]
MSLRSHWEESRRGWIWATVICALTVTIVLGVQYQYQKSRLAKIESLSRDLGHAREDLANGFLHFSLGNTPDSPWQREQGIALLNQALDAYQRATVELTPVSDTAVPMQSQLADLRNQLHVFQVQDPGQQLPVDLKLRLSIYQLTQAAAKVDSETRIELSKLAEQQDWAFKITMGLSMVLLGAMCLGSYRVVTQSLAERRRNEEALRDNEQRWRFALEGAGDGVWDWNVANNTVHFSPRWK